MIRVCLFNNQAYGYDITGWEDIHANDCYYNSLLEEDLLERVGQGDIVMYFETTDSASDWCEDNGYKYELVEPDDNN